MKSLLGGFLPVGLLVVLGTVPAQGADLLGLVDTGELFVSSDAGATWSLKGVLPVSDGVGLVAGSSSLDLFMAARSGDVYASADGGETWVAVGAVPAPDVASVVWTTDDLLLLTETGSIWSSIDGGASFVEIGRLTAPDHVSLARGEAALYALTRTGRVAVSTDGGVAWEERGAVTAPDGVEIVWSGGSELHVLTGTGDLWQSGDEGFTWSLIGTLSQVHMSGLVRTAEDGFFAVAREGEVATSADGTSWSWVGTIDQLNVTALAADEPVSGVPEATGPGSGLLLGWPRPHPVVAGAGFVTLPVQVPGEVRLGLELFDTGGRLVARGPEAMLPGAGRHEMIWPLPSLSPGVYLVRVAGPGFSAARKVVVTP